MLAGLGSCLGEGAPAMGPVMRRWSWKRSRRRIRHATRSLAPGLTSTWRQGSRVLAAAVARKIQPENETWWINGPRWRDLSRRLDYHPRSTPQRDFTERLARLDQWKLGAKLTNEVRRREHTSARKFSINLQSICHPRRWIAPLKQLERSYWEKASFLLSVTRNSMNLAISMCRLATKLHLAGVISLHGVADASMFRCPS